MSLSPLARKEIDALRAEGRHAEAARLCAAQGAHEEAARLFAEVWEWTEALQLAVEAGLFGELYHWALAARRPTEANLALEALCGMPEEALRRAPEVEARGRVRDAAVLWMAAGEAEEAARCYAAAGEHFEAGRCLEASGRYREAGREYEHALRGDPDRFDAALRLGQILARMGRYEPAARALQVAARGADTRQAAERWLIACFAALRMDEAAVARLEGLRRTHPELPSTVEALLIEAFGDRRGLLTLAAGDADGGTMLGARYRQLGLLGSGSTGRVLEAEDVFAGRSVAVKVLTVSGGGAGRDAFARFAREARVAASLSHPNVVAVHEYDPAGPFLVMELMEGGTLESRLAALEADRAWLAPQAVRQVGQGVLAGLEAVHRRGIVHRDLKPANIFFGATQDVKIGDFGVAHLIDVGATVTGALLGTLAYMAPEQITGGSRPAAATDLYAFGVILYRMLTGALPFPGPDFLTQHLEMPPRRLSELRSDLDPAFETLVGALLEKDPDRRPAQAGEVWAALAALPWDSLDTRPRGAVDGGAAAASLGRRDAHPSSGMPSEAPPGTDRYTPREILPDGAERLHDTLLDRVVLARPVDEARRAYYSRCARADGPHLQAVYGFLDEGRRVLLEEPRGVSFSEAPAAERARHVVPLRGALEALHQAGVSHGHIGPSAIRIGPGRGVLMLPDEPGGDPQADRAALEALLGQDP